MSDETLHDAFSDFNPLIYSGHVLLDGTRVTDEALTAYWESLQSHVKHVRDAGLDLGLAEQHMLFHDVSKLSPIEFPAAAMHYYGGGAPTPYSYAWHNHWHRNPHHWNYWQFSGDYHLEGSDMEDNLIRMPDTFVVEMVADWLGSSMAYTGSWDITSWLSKNLPRVSLHSASKGFLIDCLSELGYAKVLGEIGGWSP